MEGPALQFKGSSETQLSYGPGSLFLKTLQQGGGWIMPGLQATVRSLDVILRAVGAIRFWARGGISGLIIKFTLATVGEKNLEGGMMKNGGAYTSIIII